MRLWLRSVRFAMHGIAFAVRNERNMRIHIALASIAVLLLVALDVSAVETIFVLLALVMVFVTEFLNTAIEKTLDIIEPERHPLAKAAKDCAAAAVLLCAIFAIIIGLFVFGPHLMEGPKWRWH